MINHIETEKKVLDFVTHITGITQIELKSQVRTKHIVRARSIYAHIMRLFGFSYPEIGMYLMRDHTTIMHLVKSYSSHEYSRELGPVILEHFPELSTYPQD